MLHELDIHLTHRCNLQCSYCYAASNAASLPDDLPFDLADRAVDFLFDHRGNRTKLRIACWGGEPLLRLDLIRRIAQRAHARAESDGIELQVVVPTNVTLLDSSTVSMLRAHRVQLSLSLDGMPEAHVARMTPDGRSGWALIGPALDTVITHWQGHLPPVRMTVVPQRAPRLYDDVVYLLDRGFRHIAFLPASGARWGRGAVESLDRQMGRLADLLIAQLGAGSDDVPVFPHVLRRMAPLFVAGSGGGSPPLRRGFCGAGETLMAVDTRGDLYPCHRVVAQAVAPPDLRLGSLHEGITNHDLVRRIAVIGADSPGIRCSTCRLRASCGSICIALNHRAAGDIACIPLEACRVNKHLRKMALRVHKALADNDNYHAYMKAYLTADPDDRTLPMLAALQADADSVVEQAASLLANLRQKRSP